MNPRRRGLHVFIAALLVVVGCATDLIAPYDPDLDQALGELQSEISGFFDGLEKGAGKGTAAYDAVFYDQVRISLEKVRVQASARSHNEQTVTMLDLLGASLRNMEDLHRDGLAPAEVPVLRSLLETQVRMLIQLEAAKKQAAGGEVAR